MIFIAIQGQFSSHLNDEPHDFEWKDLLDQEHVCHVVENCLWSKKDFDLSPKDEDGFPVGSLFVDGVLHGYCFDPSKIRRWEPKIARLVGQAPDSFFAKSRKKPGGNDGDSFTNLCARNDLTQWTENFLAIEGFFALADAIGRAMVMFPKHVWNKLPGGMPLIFLTERRINPCALERWKESLQHMEDEHNASRS